MNLEAVFGGLVGSVATVLITKGLDIWAEREKNDFQLKKSFFEKKLVAAEGMMASYYTVTSAMSGLDALYSLVSLERDQNINWTLFSEYSDAFESKLRDFGKTANTAKESLLTFPLYFDLGDEFWDTDIHQDYLSSTLRIANLAIPLQSAIRIAKENEDPRMNEWCHEQVEKQFDGFRKEMVVLAPKIKKIKEEMAKGIKSLRSEMKKYEK
jgi:hypothetical protein